MNKPTELDTRMARIFEVYIGMYFGTKENMKRETLGEFLVSCKAIYPSYFDDWAKEEVKN
jgi:hypothetical protein